MATRLIEQLTAAWESGREMLAEEVLADHPGAAEDRDLLFSLLYEEICLRQKAGQESASVHVLKRFPQWRTELELLVDCHHLLEMDRSPPFPEVGERLGDFQLLVELGLSLRGFRPVDEIVLLVRIVHVVVEEPRPFERADVRVPRR